MPISQLETMRVVINGKTPEGDYAVINVRDFDPEKHTPFGETKRKRKRSKGEDAAAKVIMGNGQSLLDTVSPDEDEE